MAEPQTGMPRWARVLGVIIIILVIVLLVLMIPPPFGGGLLILVLNTVLGVYKPTDLTLSAKPEPGPSPRGFAPPGSRQ